MSGTVILLKKGGPTLITTRLPAETSVVKDVPAPETEYPPLVTATVPLRFTGVPGISITLPAASCVLKAVPVPLIAALPARAAAR